MMIEIGNPRSKNLEKLLDEYFPYRFSKFDSVIGDYFSGRTCINSEMSEFGQLATGKNIIDTSAQWDFRDGEFRFREAAAAIFFKLKYTGEIT